VLAGGLRAIGSKQNCAALSRGYRKLAERVVSDVVLLPRLVKLKEK